MRQIASGAKRHTIMRPVFTEERDAAIKRHSPAEAFKVFTSEVIPKMEERLE